MTIHLTWMWLLIPLAVIGLVACIPAAIYFVMNVINLIGFLIKGDEWG